LSRLNQIAHWLSSLDAIVRSTRVGLTLCLLCPWVASCASRSANEAAESDDGANADLIHLNARMALREDRPVEALKLWLLRNTLKSETGIVSDNDADLRSAAWVALGRLGLCSDGFAQDTQGAGLWPLALHNWFVTTRGRDRDKSWQPPFEAFEVQRQKRLFSLSDVLDADELRAARFERTTCWLPAFVGRSSGEGLRPKYSDPRVLARTLRYLLQVGQGSVSRDTTRGRSVLAARLFDLNLYLSGLSSRYARSAKLRRNRQAREKGLSREAAGAQADEAPLHTFAPDSEEAQLLRESLQWPHAEWMRLSPQRRLFLFEQATNHTGLAARTLLLAIIDTLIDEGSGEEVMAWIAHLTQGAAEPMRALVWQGARGRRLLALDETSGFRERSPLLLHRGLEHLQSGRLPEALRALALALAEAPSSRSPKALSSLSRRWISHVASQFVIDGELLAMLQATLPRKDFNLVLEDVLWRAAFAADAPSFQEGVRFHQGRGALGQRIEWLSPLAKGRAGVFADGVARDLNEAPSRTLRLLTSLVDRLEREDRETRGAYVSTLTRIRALLPKGAGTVTASPSGVARRARALYERMTALVLGVVPLTKENAASDRASALSPGSNVFGGSIRLAPSDPIPWPFRVPGVEPPSVFEPLRLDPLEWRSRQGNAGCDACEEVVFGWQISG